MDRSEYRPPHQLDSTSTRLLARIAAHDPEAWRQFVRVYGPVVRYWLRRAGLNVTDLADVFQEVFLSVSRTIPHYERQAGKAKFRAWLKRVVESKTHDFYRQCSKRPRALGGSEALSRLCELPSDRDVSSGVMDDGALAHSETVFLAQRVLHMVRKEFREPTWKAFQLTVIDNLTSQQAAEQLGLTAMAVRKAKSRVLQRLREALGCLETDR